MEDKEESQGNTPGSHDHSRPPLQCVSECNLTIVIPLSCLIMQETRGNNPPVGVSDMMKVTVGFKGVEPGCSIVQVAPLKHRQLDFWHRKTQCMQHCRSGEMVGKTCGDSSREAREVRGWVEAACSA
jgi:hypothetical protein